MTNPGYRDWVNVVWTHCVRDAVGGQSFCTLINMHSYPTVFLLLCQNKKLEEEQYKQQELSLNQNTHSSFFSLSWRSSHDTITPLNLPVPVSVHTLYTTPENICQICLDDRDTAGVCKWKSPLCSLQIDRGLDSEWVDGILMEKKTLESAVINLYLFLKIGLIYQRSSIIFTWYVNIILIWSLWKLESGMLHF